MPPDARAAASSAAPTTVPAPLPPAGPLAGSRSWPGQASRARTSVPASAGGSGSTRWPAPPNRAGTRARGNSGRTRPGPVAARGAPSGPRGRVNRRGWGSAGRSWGGLDLRKRKRSPSTAGWLPRAWGCSGPRVAPADKPTSRRSVKFPECSSSPRRCRAMRIRAPRRRSRAIRPPRRPRSRPVAQQAFRRSSADPAGASR